MLNTETHFAIQYLTTEGQWLDHDGYLNIPSAAKSSDILQSLRDSVAREYRCIEVVTTRKVCSWSVETLQLSPNTSKPNAL